MWYHYFQPASFCVTSGGAMFAAYSDWTSQLRTPKNHRTAVATVGNTVSDLIGPGIEPKACGTMAMSLTTTLTWSLKTMKHK